MKCRRTAEIPLTVDQFTRATGIIIQVIRHHEIKPAEAPDTTDRDMAKALGVEFLVKADLTPHEVLELINTRIGK